MDIENLAVSMIDYDVFVWYIDDGKIIAKININKPPPSNEPVIKCVYAGRDDVFMVRVKKDFYVLHFCRKKLQLEIIHTVKDKSSVMLLKSSSGNYKLVIYDSKENNILLKPLIYVGNKRNKDEIICPKSGTKITKTVNSESLKDLSYCKFCDTVYFKVPLYDTKIIKVNGAHAYRVVGDILLISNYSHESKRPYHPVYSTLCSYDEYGNLLTKIPFNDTIDGVYKVSNNEFCIDHGESKISILDSKSLHIKQCNKFDCLYFAKSESYIKMIKKVSSKDPNTDLGYDIFSFNLGYFTHSVSYYPRIKMKNTVDKISSEDFLIPDLEKRRNFLYFLRCTLPIYSNLTYIIFEYLNSPVIVARELPCIITDSNEMKNAYRRYL